jgi:hypothetical protein
LVSETLKKFSKKVGEEKEEVEEEGAVIVSLAG